MLGGCGSGSGTQMTEQSKGKYPEKHKLGRRKFVSSYHARNLLRDNPYSILKDSYRNTIECSSVKRVVECAGTEKHETSHCKNRWCDYCEAAKMAKAIAEMEEPFSQMADPHFLTLTKVTVDALNLRSSIKCMYDAWRTITKSEGNKRRKISGVRKAECTVSPNIPGHYHYHFHIIIDGEDNAEWLRMKWLSEMGKEADPHGQKLERADKGALVELSKYFNKQSTDIDEQLERTDVKANFKRLNVIYEAMRGKRALQTFGGFKRHKMEVESEVEVEGEGSSNDSEEIVTSYFYNNKGDWQTKDGDLYCGFDPSKMRDEYGKMYSEKYRFAEIVRPDEVKESKPYLEPAAWLNKWPDMKDTA